MTKSSVYIISVSLAIKRVKVIDLSSILSVGQCVCLHVCPESVLWQNGWLDPDAVWDGEWSRSRDARVSKGRWGFGGFSFPLECLTCLQSVYIAASNVKVNRLELFWGITIWWPMTSWPLTTDPEKYITCPCNPYLKSSPQWCSQGGTRECHSPNIFGGNADSPKYQDKGVVIQQHSPK